MISLDLKSIEIVGTRQGNNGRMCGYHPSSCGASLDVGTNLILRNATIQVPIETQIPVLVDEEMPIKTKKRGRPNKVQKWL
jgi:hypothetical protein